MSCLRTVMDLATVESSVGRDRSNVLYRLPEKLGWISFFKHAWKPEFLCKHVNQTNCGWTNAWRVQTSITEINELIISVQYLFFLSFPLLPFQFFYFHSLSLSLSILKSLFLFSILSFYYYSNLTSLLSLFLLYSFPRQLFSFFLSLSSFSLSLFHTHTHTHSHILSEHAVHLHKVSLRTLRQTKIVASSHRLSLN